MSASLAAFLRSFVFAFDGIAHVVRTQRNMRVHLLVAALVTLLGVWVRLSPTEWAICALTMGVVFAAEMLNTVIESLVDLASPDHHDLAKIAKDAAAGAVLVLAIFATLVGIFILLPKLLLVAGR
ncbi:MAG: diacylglycerol kinase family protein [Chloroflexota bacterium]